MRYRRSKKKYPTAGSARVIGTPLSAVPPHDTPVVHEDTTVPSFQIGRPYVKGAEYHRCYSDFHDAHHNNDLSPLTTDIEDADYATEDTPRAVFLETSIDTQSPVPSRSHAQLTQETHRRVVAPAFRAPQPSSSSSQSARRKDRMRRTAHAVRTRRSRHARIGGRRITQRDGFSWRDIPIFRHESMLVFRNISRRYTIVMGTVLACVIGIAFMGTAFAVKARIDDAGHDAVASLKMAFASMNQRDFTASQEDLDHAYAAFETASTHIGRMGRVVTFVSQFIPGASRLASGDHLVRAGAALTHAAKELHGIVPQVMEQGTDLMASDGIHISFLALYQAIADRIAVAYADVQSARSHLDRVRFEDIPQEYREMFLRVADLVPHVESSLGQIHASRAAIEDVLGAHGPRTYLLLFQNNHEMRATGGFIGSYGIVKIVDGYIDKIMVDDIYNPDGQLIDKIMPPLPIQKISANWSMHDSNWFPDYPVSARKVMDLYERTGGPTVDGVIALTPTVVQDMLSVTGPIDVPLYDMQLTAENFIDMLQEEIEDRENYLPHDTVHAHDDAVEPSEEHNATQASPQPKKILSDLMPTLLDRILAFDDPEHIADIIAIVSRGLQQRHLLIYLSDDVGEEIILKNGWGGAIEQTHTDYLSVINTNINGFKTDGVIDETITHTAQIDSAGDIVNTVQITRVHNGGYTGRPWWDAVNANYMRVYVPEGAQLLSAEGQTREVNTPRLDYAALGYERDADLVREEASMRSDDDTGTRIYTDAGKTVFANWVYVSPQERVTVTYTYKLPFTVTFDKDEQGAFGSYGLLVQKQAGSTRTKLESTVILPEDYHVVWRTGEGDSAHTTNSLDHDRFIGTVFRLP